MVKRKTKLQPLIVASLFCSMVSPRNGYQNYVYIYLAGVPTILLYINEIRPMRMKNIKKLFTFDPSMTYL